MVHENLGGFRQGFLTALADDSIIDVGAHALLFGVDPYKFIDQGDDSDFLIRIEVLKRAIELDAERRKNDLESLAAVFGVALQNNVTTILGS